jgi:hypothetical protein
MFSTILGGHLQFPGMRSWGRLSGNSTVRYRKALCLGLFTSIILNHVKSSKSKSKWAKLSPFVDFRLSQFPSPRHPKALPKALLWRPRVVVNRFPQAFIPWSGRTPRKAPVFMIWKIPIDSIVFQTPSEKSICVYIIIYIYVFFWTPSKQNHFLRMFGNPGNIWVIHMLAWIWAMKNTPIPSHEILVGW